MTTTKKLANVQVDMPVLADVLYDNSAEWWAHYLLGLGQKDQYALLTYYLELAHKNGCLRLIKAAADEAMKSKKSIKTSLRKPGRMS